MPPLSLILSTGLLALVFFNLYHSPSLGQVAIRFSLFAFAAWVLANYGDELADLLGLSSSLSSARYVGPFIRGLGWMFLTVFLVISGALRWRWFA